MTSIIRLFLLLGAIAGTVNLCACLFPSLKHESSVSAPDTRLIDDAPWGFGESADRYAPLWRKGVAGSTLTHGHTPAGADEGTAEEAAETPFLHMDVENESTNWDVTPLQRQHKSGEVIARDRHHRLKAFAEVRPDDDLSINLGPELILKDNAYAEDSASKEEPGAAWGLGMSLEYEF